MVGAPSAAQDVRLVHGEEQREASGPARRAVGGAAAQGLFAAAIDLVSAGAPAFRSTARRYSLCSHDADDAYQRGLEILITKAPTEAREELRPWLHTVIKHEALALRRQRERMLGGGDADQLLAGTAPGPEEEAAERERARQTGEALGQLKPSEIQCMLLKALGYSYDEIAARTGFSWTKVNRSLTEGRRRFFDRFAQIESGRRCGRFRPLLSAACDGEASRDDRRLLEVHLRGCQSCRATLRGYRSAPRRVAELLPATMVLPLAARPGWWARLHDLVSTSAGERAGAVGYKLQQVGELVSAQKAAAVVATATTVAGGAVAGERATHANHAPSAHVRVQPAERQRPQPAPEPSQVAVAAPPPAASTEPSPQPKAEEFDLEAEAGREVVPQPASTASVANAEAAASGGGFEDAAVSGGPGSRATVAKSTGSAAAQEFGP
jgi:RNA polymerase sigma factor (sigma-70 family)